MLPNKCSYEKHVTNFVKFWMNVFNLDQNTVIFKFKMINAKTKKKSAKVSQHHKSKGGRCKKNSEME